MANTKARVIGLIGSYELKIRLCQYVTFAYYYDRVVCCSVLITYFVVVIIFVIIKTFLPSLFSENFVHQSAKCVHVVIKPNHHLHSSLNIP